jgi:hypothetical protein
MDNVPFWDETPKKAENWRHYAGIFRGFSIGREGSAGSAETATLGRVKFW